MEVVRCADDRVVCILNIPAEPVPAPRRGYELHRALRAGRARTSQLAELRLDEVHGCEHVPRDPEPALGLSVVTQQIRCRARAGDLDRPDADRRCQVIELALRSNKIPADLCQILRDQRECSRRETRVAREDSVDALLVQRLQDYGLRRIGALGNPAADRLLELCRRLSERAPQWRRLSGDRCVDSGRCGGGATRDGQRT
jgi:hypothetical protein